jgi:hypothetical protein
MPGIMALMVVVFVAGLEVLDVLLVLFVVEYPVHDCGVSTGRVPFGNNNLVFIIAYKDSANEQMVKIRQKMYKQP